MDSIPSSGREANDPMRQIHFGPRLQKRRNSTRLPLISPTKKWQNVPILVTGVEGNQTIVAKASGQICDEAGFHVLNEAGCRCTRGRFSRIDEGRCLPKIGAGVHDTLFCQKQNRLLTKLSPSGCPQTASQGPVKRQFEEKSGRRDSNSRQPAWKAGTLPLSYSRMSTGS
jgi:hypothetical protein